MVTSMYSAIVEDKTERLRSLIEEGADVNASIRCELLVVTTFNFIIKINLTSLVEMLMFAFKTVAGGVYFFMLM